jgi:hypothetical protein
MGVVLVGCDVGENGSDMDKLSELGGEIYKKHGLKILFAVIDEVMAKVIYRLVKVAQDAGLVFENTSIGITGRAGISGNKPKLALKYLDDLNINHKIDERVVFVAHLKTRLVVVPAANVFWDRGLSCRVDQSLLI